MHGEARYRMADFFSHQLVTMRLLLLQTCTNPAMSTNELERHHIRSLLIPEQLNLFKCMEFPAVASDAPVAIFAMHDLPHELCYSQLLPGQVKSRTSGQKRFSKPFAAGFKHSASATHDLLLRSNPCDGDLLSPCGGRGQLCGRYLTVRSGGFVGGLRRGLTENLRA